MLGEYYPSHGPEDDIPTAQTLVERDTFQRALDEIAAIIDGKHLDDLTDNDLDDIREWVALR